MAEWHISQIIWNVVRTQKKRKLWKREGISEMWGNEQPSMSKDLKRSSSGIADIKRGMRYAKPNQNRSQSFEFGIKWSCHKERLNDFCVKRFKAPPPESFHRKRAILPRKRLLGAASALVSQIRTLPAFNSQSKNCNQFFFWNSVIYIHGAAFVLPLFKQDENRGRKSTNVRVEWNKARWMLIINTFTSAHSGPEERSNSNQAGGEVQSSIRVTRERSHFS